jgi:glycine/D-amino acid oxidase-like deaminating enzyme
VVRKHNIVVIGAGLFGSIATTLARSVGHTVTVVDAQRPWAASKASGCVLAPSWLSSLERGQIDTAMGVLRDLYTVHDMEFSTNLLKKFKAQRVDPSEVLLKDGVVRDEVVEVKDGVVKLASGDVLRGKVLIAAGMACNNFVPDMPETQALWGSSITLNAQLSEARLHVYAPYRQAVAFNMNKRQVWMGDGTALVEKTWAKESAERAQRTVERARELFKLTAAKPTVNSGARPYVKGHKAGYFQRVTPSVWVSTGGAKNGTVLAALQAHQFIKALP